MSPVAGIGSVFRILDERAGPYGQGEDKNITIARAPESDSMAKLIEKLRLDGRLRQGRDADFLAWRYQNPLNRYWFLFHRPQDLDGYLVLQAPLRSTFREFNIVDWEAVSEKVRQALLNAAIRCARPHSLDVWTASCSQGTVALLERTGFKTFDDTRGIAKYTPSVLIKSLRRTETNKDLEIAGNMSDQANWDLRMIYSDSF